jgi:hypothetical protein
VLYALIIVFCIDLGAANRDRFASLLTLGVAARSSCSSRSTCRW